MKEPYIAIAWELQCKPSECNTIKSFWDKWNNHRSVVNGNIKAVLADTYKEAEANLFKIVENHIKSFPDVKDGYIRLTDFQLRYNINKVEDGVFFCSNHCVQYHDFKN